MQVLGNVDAICRVNQQLGIDKRKRYRVGRRANTLCFCLYTLSFESCSLSSGFTTHAILPIIHVRTLGFVVAESTAESKKFGRETMAVSR
jgi:hypothetical protein